MSKVRAYIPLLLAAALLITAAASYGIVNSQSGNGKYDTDDDGLIEVEYLEQLDAIRYDLDGDGKADAESGADDHAAAFPTSAGESVCESNCNGYELTRSLDFDDANTYASETVNAAWTTGGGWLPMGNRNNHYGAVFNGNGHTISNLYINRTNKLNNPGETGLFGIAVDTIESVGLVDIDVTGVSNVGGLVGRNNATIVDSYVEGNVSGTRFVGGLVGENRGKISGSYVDGNISGYEVSGGLVGYNRGGTISHSNVSGSIMGNLNSGGLAGGNNGTISACYTTATVKGYTSAGGLVGSSSSWASISTSYTTGDVSGRSNVGGLVGKAGGSIESSYATGGVTGINSVGGLVGNSGATIGTAYATADVAGDSAVGGLVGENRDTVRGVYATGEVSGNSDVGGLIGRNHDDGIVGASYATGVVSGDDNVGALIGTNSGIAIGNFWDSQTSDQNKGVGVGSSAGVEDKTTAELQSPTGYTGIFGVWVIDLDNADQDFDPNTGADDYWDFGTSSQYPALKVDFNGDETATWQEFGNQVRVLPPTPTPTPTQPPTPTPTATLIPTPTYTPTPLPTATPTPEQTPTPTLTPTPTATQPPAPTSTPTTVPADTRRPEPTPTSTDTPMPEATATPVLPTVASIPELNATSVPLPTDTGSSTSTLSSPAITSAPPSLENTPAPPADSGGGACGLPTRPMPIGAVATNLFLLAAPLGMIWGLKWRGRRKREG